MVHDHHEHQHEISEKTISRLMLSFIINMLLTVVEIIGGVIAGSVSLIGDALHNTSDAFSILIAIIAFKIGHKKANSHYTYGFKRAETIGAFVNLILLFVAGCYLAVEGIEKLIFPNEIDGGMIIWVSVLALIIDSATAGLSHQGSDHNSNMKLLFLHNLADALGSVGVIVSGICALYFKLYRVDGIIALGIAVYMIYQAVLAFPKLVNILMNAAPDNLNLDEIKKALSELDGVNDVHHLHLWCIYEEGTSLECHIVSNDQDIVHRATELLKDKFDIHHCTLQVETNCHECAHCQI